MQVGQHFRRRLATGHLTLCAISIVALGPASIWILAQSRQEPRLRGEVLDGKHLPVSGAKIVFHREGRIGGVMPLVLTDDQGRFQVATLLPGTYKVGAFKDEDGFGNPDYAFYGSTHSEEPTVVITRDKTTTIRINLGDPMGRLSAEIRDAATHELLNSSRFRLSVADNPQVYIDTNPDTSAHFIQPVPSVPIICEVRMPGYVAWTSSRILIQRGEIRHITVLLKKIGSQ